MKAIVTGKVVQVESREGLVVVSMLQIGKGRPELINVLFGKDFKGKIPDNNSDASIPCSIFLSRKGGLTVFAQ